MTRRLDRIEGAILSIRGERVLKANEAAPLRSQTVTLHRGRGRYGKYLPYAFTEQGVAMLSSVLRSEQAVRVNIGIMRAFVRLRQLVASHTDLKPRLDALERKYDSQFKVVFDAIRALMEPEPQPGPARRIGFRTEESTDKRRIVVSPARSRSYTRGAASSSGWGESVRGRGSRQNFEGWMRRKTAPAPPAPKPTRPPRRPPPRPPAPPKPR